MAVESWILAALAGLRLLLAFRLAPGRDELAYWYWSWHGLDASYSLVTVGALRISTFLLGDGPAGLRLPGFLAALGATLLVVRLALRLGATPRASRWAAVAFAASPWQNYAGTIAHPDAFFTLFLVLGAERVAALFDRAGRRTAGALLGAGAAACLAALTKLTGAILLPAAAGLAWTFRREHPRAALGALAGIAATGTLLFAARDPELLAGLREFGRFAETVPPARRLATIVLEVAVSGGPGFLLLAGVGVARLRRPDVRARAAVGLLAAPVLALHTVFACLGQAKGNWFLAPSTLLVAVGAASVPRLRPVAVASAGSLALSLAAGAFVLRPDLLRELPPHRILAAIDDTYADHVGRREARVSTTRRWSERLAEYEGHPVRLPRPDGAEPPPRVCSHDYGLAFSVVHGWGRDAEAFLPWDPVFARTCGRPPAPGEDLVFVTRDGAVPPEEFAERFAEIRVIPAPPGSNDRVPAGFFHCLDWSGEPAPVGTH